MNNQFDVRSDSLKKFDVIRGMAREAGLSNNPRVFKALKVISANPYDKFTVQEVFVRTLNFIKATPGFLAQQSDQNPFKPYPSLNLDGPFRIGRVFNPYGRKPMFFGLHPHEINQNTLVAGRAGAGKTNLFMIFLAGFLGQQLPFWIFDFKQDYRHLLRQYPDLLVFNCRNFKWNPLVPPPGCDPLIWIQIFTDLFFEIFFPSEAMASKNAFLEVLDQLFQQTRDRHGANTYPSLFDLSEALDDADWIKRNFPPKHQTKFQTIQSRLRPMLRLLGPMFDCQKGFPLEELLQRPVVFEYDSLVKEYQAFGVNLFFYWTFNYRLHNTQRGKLLHGLIFDEAKMVFAKNKATASSTITQLISQSREIGEAILSADQMPSSLGHSIMANVFTTMVLNLSAAKDINEIGYALGLNSEQRQFINKLPVGTAIVKLADRYPNPFLIEIPEFKIEKNVSNAEVEHHMAPHLASLKYEPRLNDVADLKPEPQESTEPTVSKPAPQEPSGKYPWGFDEITYTFLMDIKNRPFVPVTERTKTLNLNSYKANNVGKFLVKEGLLEPISIKTGRLGRAAKFFQLTEKAITEIGHQNMGPGKGGFEHVYHQHRLAAHFAGLGYTAKIEEYRNGKAVDLGISNSNGEIAIEIAMSLPGEIDNILKDISAGWIHIKVLCHDKKIMAKLETEWLKQVGNYPEATVEITLLADKLVNSN